MIDDVLPSCLFMVNFLISRGERDPALANTLVSSSQPDKQKEGRERCKRESRKAEEIYFWNWGQHSGERGQCQGPKMGAMTHAWVLGRVKSLVWLVRVRKSESGEG